MKSLIRLQWVVVIPFLLQIFGAVGLVGYLSFRSGREAVEDLAEAVMGRTNRVVAEHLNSYLGIPQQLSQLNADAIGRGILDVNDPISVSQYFWDQMQIYDLTYLGLGFKDGSGVGLARYDGETVTIDDWVGTSSNNIITYATDAQGNRAEELDVWTWINAEETWYTDPIAADKPIWTIIATTVATGPYVVASASRPIYDGQGELLGMLAVDVHLLKLGDFLRGLDISTAGSVFVVEQDGTLIANSGEAPPFAIVDESTERIPATQSADPLVQQVARTVQQDLGGFENLGAIEDFQVRLDGQTYFVDVQPWQDAHGLSWRVVVAVPEQEFLAQINANTRNTIALCGLALLGATGLGLFTSRWVIRPISQLNRASRAVATGNLEQTVPGSSIQELDELTTAFNHMARQLQDSFLALEVSKSQLEDRVTERTAELKATLTELRSTQAQVIQNEKMSSLGQLVAGIAHEINNPVNFIHGNLIYCQTYVEELLGLVKLYEQYYPEPGAAIQDEAEAIDWEFMQVDLPQMLTSMQTGTDRIREIILSLRNFSRTDEAALKQVNIHDGIESTLMILRHRLKAQTGHPAIAVVKDYGELPPVECYPGPLNQVFMNILSNAIDALEEQSQQRTAEENQAQPLQITLRTQLRTAQWLQIAIADNGTGIPDAVQAQIFEPFFTTKEIGQGTGMGMSISQQIITERHHGTLVCHSQVGQGTEFVIEIPVQQTLERQPPQQSTS